MRRFVTLSVAALAVVFVLSYAVPAVGGPGALSSASPVKLAKRALKTAKKADRRSKQALAKFNGVVGTNIRTVTSAPFTVVPGGVGSGIHLVSPGHRRDLRRFLADRPRGQRVLRPQERQRLDGRRRQCRRRGPRYWIPDRAVHDRRTMRSDWLRRRLQSFRKRGPSPRPPTGGAAEGHAPPCAVGVRSSRFPWRRSDAEGSLRADTCLPRPGALGSVGNFRLTS